MRIWQYGSASLLCIAVVGGLSGCNKEPPPNANATGGDDLPAVKIVKLSREDLKRTTTQPATVHALHRAEIYAKVAGYLKPLPEGIDIGAKVKPQQPLARILVPDLDGMRERKLAEIAKLEANETRAESQITLAVAESTAAESETERAATDVRKADAQLAADEATFKRVEELVNNQQLAARLLAEARKRRDSSSAAVESAKAQARSAKASEKAADAKISVAMADWWASLQATKVAQRELDEIDVQIGYATLTAPFAGVVVERNVDQGDLVRNNQTAGDVRKPLFVVAHLKRMRVRVAVPEAEAPYVDVGDPATLRIHSAPGREFPGSVTRTSNSLDNSTQTMLVEIELDNDDRALLPGMFGQATIVLETREKALVAPANAVRHDSTGKASLYVVQPDDTIRIVPVKTGSDDGERIEIIGDVDENARLAGPTIGRLEDGQRVRVMD